MTHDAFAAPGSALVRSLFDRAPPRAAPLRVAITHDWMVRYGGAERCLLELVHEFPGAEILTTIVHPHELPQALRGAQPSWLQLLPGAQAHHGFFLPLMPVAWGLRPRLSDADVVISSSYSFAKSVRIHPGVPHVCYCHTPMRYAWYFDDEARRLPAALRPFARAGMGAFRRWDSHTAGRVTHFVANSSAVRSRIRRFYHRDADVVHPPVRTEYFTPDGKRGEDFLYVGRLVSYKRPDLVVRAFARLPYRLRVIGSGHLYRALRATATPNVEFVGAVSDTELRGLYRSARALVYPGVEDFGIVMAEAQAAGTPVIASCHGGAADIVRHGETGWLLGEQSVEAVRRAVVTAANSDLSSESISAGAQRFSEARFRSEMRAIVETVTARGSTGGE